VYESTKRYWDVVVGIAAPFITVIGIIIGVHQFNAGEHNKVELQHEMEENKIYVVYFALFYG
jgi:hypothetical protein